MAKTWPHFVGPSAQVARQRWIGHFPVRETCFPSHSLRCFAKEKFKNPYLDWKGEKFEKDLFLACPLASQVQAMGQHGCRRSGLRPIPCLSRRRRRHEGAWKKDCLEIYATDPDSKSGGYNIGADGNDNRHTHVEFRSTVRDTWDLFLPAAA